MQRKNYGRLRYVVFMQVECSSYAECLFCILSTVIIFSTRKRKVDIIRLRWSQK